MTEAQFILLLAGVAMLLATWHMLDSKRPHAPRLAAAIIVLAFIEIVARYSS